MACENITISNFLNEKSVLIIGAKDVICETLTKKILNHCNAWHIYIIVHEDPEIDKDNLKIPLFENTVKNEIILMDGNLSQYNLGLRQDQVALLRENISVVYYTGITDYKVSLKKAIKINLIGASQVLNFCRQIKHLEALVYISSAFSCTDDSVLNEVIYRQPISPEILMEYSNWMNEYQLQHVMKQFKISLNGFVLTKNLSEELISSEKNEFPIAVIRPSIVMEMSDALMQIQKNVAILNSEVKLESGKTVSADLVYVNQLVNLLLSASWYLSVHRPEFPVVYHCTGNLKPTVKFKKILLPNLLKKCISYITDWRNIEHSITDPETLYKPFLKESFKYEDSNRIQLKKLMNDEDKAILSTDERMVDCKYSGKKLDFLKYSSLPKKYNILLKILIFFLWKRYVLRSTPATHLLFTSAVILFELIKAGNQGFKYIRRHY